MGLSFRTFIQTRGYALTLVGTECLMLGRRGWFDAGLMGMVQCWVEKDGSMLGQNDNCLVGTPN